MGSINLKGRLSLEPIYIIQMDWSRPPSRNPGRVSLFEAFELSGDWVHHLAGWSSIEPIEFKCEEREAVSEDQIILLDCVTSWEFKFVLTWNKKKNN